MSGKIAALVWGALLAALAILAGAFTADAAVRFDWFLLDLVLLSAIYVPLERLFPRVRQPVLRDGFATDFAYFFANHVLVNVLMFMTVLPATKLLGWARHEPVVRAVATQPVLLQLAEIVVVADLFQYGAHRLFHSVPILWRVHAVHHSSKRLDWLAASRLNVIDIVVVRAVTFAPLFVAGFGPSAIRAYGIVVAVTGAFLHANLRFRFGVLEKIWVTPRYHAFHHAADRDALDKNFAFHLPFIDRIFGTQCLPERAWPERYGIASRSEG